MSDNVGRIFGAIGALAALWIVVYWWWEPTHPRISLDTTAPATAGAAITGPRSQPPPATVPLITPAITSTPTTGPATTHAPIAEPPKMAVIPPKFRDYSIKQGDTMESIAEHELGSRKLVDAIRSANPLMDPDRLKIGRTIRIPLDPTNIQGKPVPVDAAAAPTPAATPATTAATMQATEYTVKPGDTLSGIAKAKYGSTKFKDLIFQANRDILASEDDVREGQRLKLPAKQ